MNIIDELKWRGAVNQQTDEEGLYKLVGEKSISLYCGIDPTGDSMHIGHLIPFMILKRFQLAGHHPVIVIGGGTGSIGDPSGRKTERVLQSAEQVKHNAECLTNQMKRLFGEDGFTMVNNYDWLSQISLWISFVTMASFQYQYDARQGCRGISPRYGDLLHGILLSDPAVHRFQDAL